MPNDPSKRNPIHVPSHAPRDDPVEAATQAEAERKLRTVLETSDANLGFLDNAPIVVPVAIEGHLDLIDAKKLTRPQRGSRSRSAPANERR